MESNPTNMESNPTDASDCKCQTVFHGTDKSPTLRKQLLKLGKFIDARSFPAIKRHSSKFKSMSSQFILSDRDLQAVTTLLDNGAYVEGKELAVKLNAKMDALKRFLADNEKNIDTRMFHESALNLALLLNLDVDVINELLIHGADASRGNSEGETPLHRAVSCARHTEIITQLLKYGADADSVSSSGFTPLQMAVCYNNDVTVIEELIKYGAHANKAGLSFYGSTPLTIAVLLDRDMNIIQSLIKGGALVRITNERGDTPLSAAARKCNDPEIIKELFKHVPGRLDLRNRNNLLDIAFENNMLFIKILIKQALITFDNFYHRLFELGPHEESSNYAVISRYLEDCICEVVQMHSMIVKKNGFSLFQLVTTENTSIGLYSNDENITNEDNIIANYPIYNDLILPKVRYALKRGVLLNKLDNVRFYSNWSSSNEECVEGEEKVLPHDHTYIMAKFLPNADLQNFITVFRISHKKPNHVASNSCTADVDKETKIDFSELQPTVATKRAKLE